MIISLDSLPILRSLAVEAAAKGGLVGASQRLERTGSGRSNPGAIIARLKAEGTSKMADHVHADRGVCIDPGDPRRPIRARRPGGSAKSMISASALAMILATGSAAIAQTAPAAAPAAAAPAAPAGPTRDRPQRVATTLTAPVSDAREKTS